MHFGLTLNATLPSVSERFNGLDLNLLVALDAMRSERSIRRAAEQPQLSQSAMSAALSRLRVSQHSPYQWIQSSTRCR